MTDEQRENLINECYWLQKLMTWSFEYVCKKDSKEALEFFVQLRNSTLKMESDLREVIESESKGKEVISLYVKEQT